ncbi:aminotransferase class IV [Maribacter sp. 2-571]|uniref:aminotransferase class IV n=1 Tax=Maribacter sp. 2-571 TaxID=3417569 RepID=UPI003D3390DD
MIDFNGKLLPYDTPLVTYTNRGLRYGDSVFETLRVVNGTLFFWEDHYLRLMASMRILRMQIPMHFTMEALEARMLAVLQENGLEGSAARIRLTVFRNEGGLYLPQTNTVSLLIEATAIDAPYYQLGAGTYEIELFKDYYVNPDMLSNLKTNNKMLNVVGSIFAKENGYQNCLLLNTDKKVVEALNGNLFLVKGKTVVTPPLADGCLKGIIREKLITILQKWDGVEFNEASISPFELQKADELWVTNTIMGIRPVTKYRKREYGNVLAQELVGKLNAAARLAV